MVQKPAGTGVPKSKSKQHNKKPLNPENATNSEILPKESPNPKSAKSQKLRQKGFKKDLNEGAENVKTRASPYVGLSGKPGVSKLPVMKAKGNKGKITRKSLKGKKALQKKIQERRMREPQIKPKRQIDQADKTEKLVSKYKQNLEKASKGSGGKKSKWYK